MMNATMNISSTTSDEELLPVAEMNTTRISAVVSIFIISILGIFVNLYCFIKMLGRERFKTIFHMLNRTRMISNIVILLVFLAWVIPCTVLGQIFLPRIFNKIFGQLAGWGAYWMGPATQFCISISRFLAAYTPFFYRRMETTKTAWILISICLFYCTILFGMGMRDGCSFEYVPELISFLPLGECAMGFDTFINVTFFGFFVITTILNVATAIRILRIIKHVSSSSDRVAFEKERRNWKQLAQESLR